MRRFALHPLLLFCFLSLFLTAVTSLAKSPPSEEEKNEMIASARSAFMEMVTLWKDEKFAGLYEYGTLRSQQRLSREEFEERMRKAKKRLECCWATVQDVQGVYRSKTEVHIKAKMGYRPSGTLSSRRRNDSQISENPSFAHETFYLIYQDGRWRVNLYRILERSEK